jgi:hypothetical protein
MDKQLQNIAINSYAQSQPALRTGASSNLCYTK